MASLKADRQPLRIKGTMAWKLIFVSHNHLATRCKGTIELHQTELFHETPFHVAHPSASAGVFAQLEIVPAPSHGIHRICFAGSKGLRALGT